MIEPWPAIVATIRSRDTTSLPSAFRRALGGIETLAASIAEGPLASNLFGWTSMFDLCIQQTDGAPYAAAYLRVSPLPSGLVEFRYVDTGKGERQWHREVPADAVIARLGAFLRQLHWIAALPDTPSA